MKFLCYIFFRLRNYYHHSGDIGIFSNISAYIATVGILWMNILTIMFFMSTLFFKSKSLLDFIFTNNAEVNKFLITPLILIPIFLFVHICIKILLPKKIKEFENENNIDKIRNGEIIVSYIILSLIFLLLSIVSPLYLKS